MSGAKMIIVTTRESQYLRRKMPKTLFIESINNPTLGTILIEFNFSQQDKLFQIQKHVIGDLYVSSINIYYRKI